MVMERTLRPYVTAGVVVAGAGLIAAAPVGPAALEIQTRAVQLAAVGEATDLAARQEFPIVDFTEAYNNTVTNLQDIANQMAGNPTPILSQIETNMTGYANDIANGFQTSNDHLTTALQDLGPLLTQVMSDLQSGDVFDADNALSQFLLSTPLVVTRPVFGAFFEVAQSMATNLDNVLTANVAVPQAAVPDIMSIFAVPAWFTDLRLAPLYGPNAAEYAMAGVTQDVINALQGGDTTLALNDLSNAPSTILDAYLNGYQVDSGPFTKLLSDAAALRGGLDPSEGALNGGRQAIIRAEEIIAGDLGGRIRAEDTLAAADTSASTDWNTLVADLGNLLSPNTALGEMASAFDPNAVADLTSLLSGDLAPGASAWVSDLFSLY
jgi:hypothetical protein